MGIGGSKGTRRISFDNEFSPLSIADFSHSIENNVLDINALSAVTEKENDLVFPEPIKSAGLHTGDNQIDYWANRIDVLRKEHRMINEIIETEFEKTIENATKVVQAPNVDNYDKIKACFEWRNKILQCYEQHPREPLVCSPLVRAFSECVTAAATDRSDEELIFDK